jgi:AcrR family transcriptional regulator
MAGRPRSSTVDDAILRSTLELAERHGYRGVSIEGVSAHSGVAKQTIYRRYSNKGLLFLDALIAFAAEQLPVPDTGTLQGDLAELLGATFTAQQGASGVLNQALAIEALQDDVFAEQLWERLIDQRRQVVRDLIARARDRGEVHHPDDEFLVDLVFGPMWYWLLFDRRRLDVDYAATLAHAVCRVAALPPA